MKRIVYLIFCLFLCLGIYSQELKVKSFTLASNDLEARTNPVLDKEDKPCALVKIPMGDEIANVDGFVISIKDHYGEKWVYLTNGSKEIVIFPKHGKSLKVYFPDYGINGVVGKCTYVLDLVKATGGAESIMQQNQSLIIRYTPSTATVLVDNKMVRGNNGVAKTTLPVGQHSFVVFCDGYESEEGTVKLKASAPSNLQITLTKEAVAVGNASSTAEKAQTSVGQSSTQNQITSVSTPASSNNSGYSSGSSYPSSTSNTISIPVKDGINIEMVKVEAGTFMMGATKEMKHVFGGEKPAHQVSLTNDYYIGKYEVTQKLWQAVMGRNPSNFKGDNLPVETVNWNDCQEFIFKLNGMTGRKFRLPTEAEWEYAARGGKKGRGYQYSGSRNISDVAWYKSNSGSKTHTVGTKKPNELGIYDMTGNVSEWCQDWYGSYSSSPQVNPIGATSGDGRLIRGSCWYDDVKWLACLANRVFCNPNKRNNSTGLRLALSE